MNVLVLNCGSSSVKYQLFRMPEGVVAARGSVQRIGDSNSVAAQTTQRGTIERRTPIGTHEEALSVVKSMLVDAERGAIARLTEIGACGHRVVHGGERFTASALVTPEVERAVEEFEDLAPLHNPPNLAGIRVARSMLSGIPQVACFDTAFHQTIPPVGYLYALPYELYRTQRIRKYGFHGTSHRWVTRRAAQLLNVELSGLNMISCHLGNGCSITAVKCGASVDTSMGFTPLEGLVMGTRSGDLDPAVVLYLLRHGYDADRVDSLLNKESGLLGISGMSNDLRDLSGAPDNERARLALDIFAYRVRKYIGSYLAVLNGCRAIVFTGGIGENAVDMRARILDQMDCLGIVMDEARNKATAGRMEGRISAERSAIAVLVIPTDEEAAIAHDTYAVALEALSSDTGAARSG